MTAGPPPFTSGDVHVWSTRSGADAPVTRDILDALGPDDRVWADRLRAGPERARRVRARATLRVLLGGYLDADPTAIRLRPGPHGKPELAAPESPRLRFNVSHSGAVIVVVFARDRAVGVDVERVQPELAWEPVARSVLSATDVATINASPRARQVEEFFDAWVRREAYLKGLGEGLGVAAPDEVIVPSDDRPVRDERSTEVRSWRVHRLHIRSGYASALAAPGENRIRCLPVEPFAEPRTC
jgi:4'-phosphopantetheinyl transferase